MKERLRPTPVHAHYVFSLHDVARVVQGILLMSPRSRIRKMRTKKKAEREEASKCGTCSCLHQFFSIAGNMMYTSKCVPVLASTNFYPLQVTRCTPVSVVPVLASTNFYPLQVTRCTPVSVGPVLASTSFYPPQVTQRTPGVPTASPASVSVI